MNIPAAKLESFVLIDPEGEARGSMQHAWFDREGSRLLATDGHRAIRVNVGVEEDDVSGLVPKEVFELARKELKAITKRMGKEKSLPDPWLRVVCGPDVVIIENLLTLTKHLVDRPKLADGEKYPSIDAVYPTSLRPASVTVDRGLLGEILAGLDGDDPVSLWVEGADKSVVIATPAGTACVLLMPMHSEPDQREVIKRGTTTSPSMPAPARP